MLTKKYLKKIIENRPNMVYGKRHDYKAIEKGNKITIYMYRYDDDVWIKYATCYNGNFENFDYHYFHGNQFVDENGAGRAGGYNGRYPGCGLGSSPKNNFGKVGKVRKANILILC